MGDEITISEVKETAREIARFEQKECPRGLNNISEIEHIKEDQTKMETQIKEGFENVVQETKAMFEAKETKEAEEKKQAKSKDRWTVDKIIIIVIAIVTIAVNIHGALK